MPELDRRDFLKLVGAGAGAAASAGCSEPVERLIPYVVQPEEITPGIPVVYASSCTECPAGCGLHVRTREGRPIKLEGNPNHPINQGTLCARGQAGIGRTYHPDRMTGPLRREGGVATPIGWDGPDGAISLLSSRIQEARSAGKSVVVLGTDRGPTANRWIDAFVDAVSAERVVYEPLGADALREATRTVFGVPTEPVFDLSESDLIVDFGSDFLATGLSPTENARQLREARDVSKESGRAARLVSVGPRMDLTTSNADEWLAARPGSEGILALALARLVLESGARGEASLELGGLLSGFDVVSASEKTGLDAAAIRRLGKALATARAPVALPPGSALTSRRAVAVNAAVLILNSLLGATGTRMKVHSPDAGGPRYGSYREVLALVDAMKSGRVGVLLVHDVNPLHGLPQAAGFAEALERVPFVVSFASIQDETSERADLVVPDHSSLESWGDAEPRPGVRSLIQPTVRPLYDTRPLVDTLLSAGHAMGGQVSARLPQGSFQVLLEQAWSGSEFRQALARGGSFRSVPSAAPELQPSAAGIQVAEPLLDGDGDFALVAYPSPLLYDGRGAALPWLQEIPDPVTKIAWQSWAEISQATADRLSVEFGDVLRVETPIGVLEVPALPRGGIRDDVIAIPMGQGHDVGYWASRTGDGHPGEARGVNVLSLLPAATDETGGPAWLSARASVTPTGRNQRLPLVQHTDNKRGRQLGETVSLLALAEGAHDEHHGSDGDHGGGHGDVHAELSTGLQEIRRPYDPAADAAPDSPYRWGMSIDLDRCTGCSACVAACYVENNIPVVGEQRTLMMRQMSWIRIERYVGEGEPTLETGRPAPRGGEQLGDTDVRHSPMLCQQCGAAPCEPVCPVIATFHNDEGLNGMVYNRCVGTRYCSNNCPYKVRRFNYFDYTREKVRGPEGWPGAMSLMANPDVTVRGQGVMEKCSFCVQRIHAARQEAKDAGREIRDGEVTPACAQACPTQAITFGNTRDEKSHVVHASDDSVRSYHALHSLNTRPAITYLAKVTRGPVEG
jgi:molybdopterin-containing oxidoreductase family iron-sulfur binding subunit